MMSVLKNVGKGILYIIGLPFFLLILVLTGIAGIFVLIFMFFKSIILFFTGRSLDDELPEDRKARLIKEGKPGTIINAPQDEPVVNTYIPPEPQPQPSSIEEAVFGQRPEPTPEPDPAPMPEPVQEERSSDEIFDSILGTTTAPKEEEEFRTVDIESPKPQEDPIREYVPHKSQQRIVDDTEEEEESSATNIYFGGNDE